MIVLTSIYQILIGPLELLLEVVFSIAYRILGNPGAAIVLLGLAMGFIALPFHLYADAMQRAERDRFALMKPELERIRKTLTGNERSMAKQACYRQSGYKPLNALKGSVSLFLQIPLFIAAYHFLSNLGLLQGESFGPLSNLGAPDALIQIGDASINLLPLLMAAINIVSAIVSLRGFPVKDKILMYGVTAIFLVLLYDSPSGLVLYWTLNNLFLLAKNLFCKLKRPGRVLAALASIVGVAFVVFAAVSSTGVKLRILAAVCGILLQTPILLVALRRRGVHLPRIPEATKKDDRAFLLGGLFLALLTGVLIPLSVIQAAPGGFVDPAGFQSPFWYVFDAFLVAFGMFVVWLGIFYRLASPRGRYVLGAALLVVCGVFLVDYLLFGTGYGNLSPVLQYDAKPAPTSAEVLANLGAIAVTALIVLLVWKKKRAVATIVYGGMCIVAAALFAVGSVQVNADLEDARTAASAAYENTPHFTLSSTGKNVVVIMMDRAVPAFIPFIMQEYPEIAEQLDGFVWYSNTLSYGSLTNVGSPGLYGGYEYIPENMNARSDVSLCDKQNEALKVMPILFDDAGYDVTVFDPTYAGYGWTPDVSIYDDRPDINAYLTMNGKFQTDEFGYTNTMEAIKSITPRNFFCYSIFRVAPLFAHKVLYDDGFYNSTLAYSLAPSDETTENEYSSPQYRDGLSKAEGVDEDFLNSYAVLQNLPEMTVITDSAAGGFLMMSNDTPHNPMLLQEPGCVPSQIVDNVDYDREHDVRYDAQGNTLDFSIDENHTTTSKHMHYEVDVASWRELGNWFDYLREQGVYDNTRIIVVSDHGQHLRLRDDMILDFIAEDTGEALDFDMQIFNCTLLIKDFNATGFVVDDRFMTNADTPLLATGGLIQNPVNPFTGNPLADDEKHDAEHHVQWPTEWSTKVNNGNVFLPGHWFCLTGDNVLDASAWSYLGNY